MRQLTAPCLYLFVLTSPTLFSEERESSGETVPIPEVVQQRAAGETSGSDGHDQGDQAQHTAQEHERGGALQVRRPHSKMSPQIKDQFSKKKSLSPKKRKFGVSPGARPKKTCAALPKIKVAVGDKITFL